MMSRRISVGDELCQKPASDAARAPMTRGPSSIVIPYPVARIERHALPHHVRVVTGRSGR
jgi:hypothetical protein